LFGSTDLGIIQTSGHARMLFLGSHAKVQVR
jgi:hypothetical protein